MRFLTSILLVVLASTAAVAAPQILNWKSTEVSEAEALKAAQVGVQNLVENDNACELVNLWGFEAINHLKDFYGNPLIVVTSIAETQGPRCELAKYQDCSTVFVKEDGQWKYDDTTCDKEEPAE